MHSATVDFSATACYFPDDSVTVTFQATLNGSGKRNYAATVRPGGSITFIIGYSQSFLNGRNGFYYNGQPDLEAENDTDCCSIIQLNANSPNESNIHINW